VGFLIVERKNNSERIARLLAKELGQRGWDEERNLSIDLRYTQNTGEAGQLAAALVATKPDVLIGAGAYPVHSLRDATRGIPIVMLWIADPVGRGLVSNLSRPGGNLTGVSHFVGAGLMEKIFELLREMIPSATRIAVLINPANPIYQIRGAAFAKWRARIEAAQGVASHTVGARTVGELPGAIDEALKWGAQALIVTTDSVFSSVRETIVRLAAEAKLPAVYPDATYVERGGLVSYSTDFVGLIGRAAYQVDKILRGANPGDLPIEQPTQFVLAVNLGTAKRMGIAVPQSILLRADRILK
jgi:putative ABC transport system substrate-binding protein